MLGLTSTSAGIRRSKSSKKMMEGACHAASSNHFCILSLSIGTLSSATSAQLISIESNGKFLSVVS
jgi:hypothetical protein